MEALINAIIDILKKIFKPLIKIWNALTEHPIHFQIICRDDPGYVRYLSVNAGSHGYPNMSWSGRFTGKSSWDGSEIVIIDDNGEPVWVENINLSSYKNLYIIYVRRNRQKEGSVGLKTYPSLLS
jgi:hypothetical protein